MDKNVIELLNRNEIFRDIHKDKRCFILGNGPSLNTQDLTLLKDDINIVVNSFFPHKDSNIVNPKYWVMVDPLYWKAPHVAFYNDYEKFLERNVTTNLFAPVAALPLFSKTMTSPRVNLYYYGFDSDIPVGEKLDFTKILPGLIINVVMVGVMLAFYLGCNPIYLIGCDHDFFITQESQFRNNQLPHFYEEYNDYKDSDNMSWDWFQYLRNATKQQYEKIIKYATLWGYNIYNATNGGYLEAFSRVEYESLFGGEL